MHCPGNPTGRCRHIDPGLPAATGEFLIRPGSTRFSGSTARRLRPSRDAPRQNSLSKSGRVSSLSMARSSGASFAQLPFPSHKVQLTTIFMTPPVRNLLVIFARHTSRKLFLRGRITAATSKSIKPSLHAMASSPRRSTARHLGGGANFVPSTSRWASRPIRG